MSRSPRDEQTAPEVRAVADAVAAVFAGAFDQLAAWRSPIEQTLETTADMRPAALDDVVADLVLPHLMPVPDHAEGPLFVGAGVIADGEIVRGRDVHFAWWLGPLDANPVLGSTTEPTRLDLSTRGYTEYLRDFRALEWYRIPATTRDAHVTGPYVDHLCTCDYILTLTVPVHAVIDGPEQGARMVGVLGADIAVRRLEHELLAEFLAVPRPLALVNAEGRVLLSTEPSVQVGQLAAPGTPAVVCAGTPFTVLVEPAAPLSK